MSTEVSEMPCDTVERVEIYLIGYWQPEGFLDISFKKIKILFIYS